MRKYGYRLIPLLAAATLPVALSASGFVWYVARQERAAVDRLRVEVAARAASLVDRALEADIGVLRALAVSTNLDAGDPEAFREELRRVVSTRPAWFTAIVLDRDGWQVLNIGHHDPSRRVRAADPASVEEVVRTGRPVVGGVNQPGPVFPRPGVAVRVPVSRAGVVRHVLTAVLAPESFRDLLRDAEVPPAWTAAVVDRQGLIVARSRDHERFVGRPASATAFQARAGGARSAVYAGVTLDGVAVLGAYATSAISGWTVHVGVPEAVVNAQGRRAVAAVAAGGAAGVLLAALLGWSVQRELVERRARAAEEALRESEQRLRATQEHAGVGIAEADAEGRLLRVNATMSAIAGRPHDELLGRAVFDITNPEDAAGGRPEYARLVAGEIATYAREERYVASDGSERWVEVAAAAVRDAAGRFRYGVWVVQDVHERKLAEARQRLLSDELNHRVKNTLAVVRGIAARTLADDRPPAEARWILANRLGALARAHEALAASDWTGARLRALVEAELRPFGARAALDGPDLALAPKAAQTLSLVLHELATNAAKHGGLSTPEGRVEVAWELREAAGQAEPAGHAEPAGSELRLRWRERGGPPVTPPERRGFGRTLVEQGWRHELGGEVSLDFRPDGLTCELAAPAATVVAA